MNKIRFLFFLGETQEEVPQEMKVRYEKEMEAEQDLGTRKQEIRFIINV